MQQDSVHNFLYRFCTQVQIGDFQFWRLHRTFAFIHHQLQGVKIEFRNEIRQVVGHP